MVNCKEQENAWGEKSRLKPSYQSGIKTKFFFILLLTAGYKRRIAIHKHTVKFFSIARYNVGVKAIR